MKSDSRSSRGMRLMQSGLVLVIAMMGFGLTGCASQAELPPQSTQKLTDLRDQLMKGKAQVQSTCNAARDVTTRPQGAIEPQVERLVKSIGDLEDMATEHREGFASAQEKANAYFAQWDRQLDGMSASIADQGERRREESMKTFAELKARVDALRAEFRPMMASLSEASRYLGTDGTAAGVKVVTPKIKEALSRENGVMNKADAVIAQIDAMRGGK